MDIQSSPVCVLSTVSSIGVSDVTITTSQNEPLEEEVCYLISLEQADGTSELVQLTKEQATALGIYLSQSPQNSNVETVESAKDNVLKPIKNVNEINTDTSSTTTKPLGSSENPIELIRDKEGLHSTQNISADYLQEIARALYAESVKDEGLREVCMSDADDSENIVYRVMFPDELQLKPSQSRGRGRPKKRLKIEKVCEPPSPPKEVIEECKPVQNVRTRSGRITRPPKHIRKDFSKIEKSEADNDETDTKLVEFGPLATKIRNSNESKLAEKDQPIKKRKRPMSSQYRCPKCKKAYLGHLRLLQHINKHPDHGPIPQHSKTEDNDTWNYLIDIANSNPIGQRGTKFLKQLIKLLQNVQIVAKFLFKRSSGVEKNFYFIDTFLSKVLDMDSGNYFINENYLRKDADILQFITEDISNCNNVNIQHTPTFDLHAYVEKNPLDNQERDGSKRLKQSESGNLIKTFAEIQNVDTNVNITSTKLQPVNFDQGLEFEQRLTANFPSEHRNISSCNDQQSSLTNSGSEYDQNDLLAASSLLNSLPTLRTSVDELILNNVDSTQVTNLLDNSTSSDEAINVDQFVNERFKNFTDPEIELPNPSLSLDLPPLDLFQFHSS